MLQVKWKQFDFFQSYLLQKVQIILKLFSGPLVVLEMKSLGNF